MTILIAVLLAPLSLLTFCFVLEILVGVRPLRNEAAIGSVSASTVVIVPAHDEEAILAARLSSLQNAVEGQARILVVADNCTDATASIARRLGVEVIERFDPERRGKGFALDFARNHLAAQPPDIVLIVDADCVTDAHSIGLLVDRCAASGSPCQATYIQQPGNDSSPAVQVSTFAFFIKNVVRQRALQRLAKRAHLVGSGMAFPWAVFSRAELATSNIVEDLKLGQELADAGHAPLFVEQATVWSAAETERNTLSQRRRWEGGYLQNAVCVAPSFLVKAAIRGDERGLWAAINLMIPPISLLMFLDLVALALAGLAWWLAGAGAWPGLILAATVLLAGAALALAWLAGGSKFVTIGGLARVPFYLLWKLPLYLGFARGGVPKEWLRTNRSDP